MKAVNFASMTDKELVSKLADLKAELFNLRFSHATGNLTNPLALKTCKKDIAKVKTILRERELGIAKDVPAPTSDKKKVVKKATRG